MTAPDRVAAFRDDIAASPEALARLLDAWRPPDLGERATFRLAGLGSSRYAALVAAGAVRGRGGTAWVEYAGGERPGSPDDDLVTIAISASGRTAEVIATAERQAGRGLVVAVTNDPESALATRADIVVPLHAGEEVAGIAGRAYRATIAALALMTGVTTVDELRPSVDALGAAIAAVDWVDSAAEALDGAASIDVLAGAPLVGLAEQAALMLREAPRLPAHAYESADWLHTGVYLALPDHRVVLMPGSDADGEIVATVERRAGAVVRLPTNPGTGSIVRAIVESVRAEQLGATLWSRVDAQDRLDGAGISAS